jgi:SSS family solute:Na+ symporter
VAQIGFAARDERSARRGFVLGGLLILPIGFISALFGMVAAARFPGLEPALALPRSILELHPALAGITLAGLWAADVSTACALLLGSSTLVVNDLFKPLLRRELSPKAELLACRLAVLAVSGLTLLLALRVASILQTLLVGLSLTTAYTLVILATLYVPSLCRRSSAWVTLAVGIAVLAAWQFLPGMRVVSHPIYAEWIVCLAAFLLVPLVDRRRIVAPGAPRRDDDPGPRTPDPESRPPLRRPRKLRPRC